MDEPDADVALLAPVHEVHLESGLAVCAEQGAVAFGTDAGMPLATFSHLVGESSKADVLFYATHSTIVGAPAATYPARFVEYVGALPNGKAPASIAKFRPQSTEDDGEFMSFYVVSGLHKLADPQYAHQARGRGQIEIELHPDRATGHRHALLMIVPDADVVKALGE